MQAKLSWRILWYSVLIWLAAIIISQVVIIPWFYPVLALVFLLTTVYYFKIVKPLKIKRGRKKLSERDRVFTAGLIAALFWFVIISLLKFLEIVGFYYFNVAYYFSDFRNWYLYALVLLVPVIYSLILENTKRAKRHKVKYKQSLIFGLHL